MGEFNEDFALSKNVFCWVGETVLMLEKANPTSPSDPSEVKEEETFLASSTAWPLTTVEPMVTVSVPTEPEALLPSP